MIVQKRQLKLARKVRPFGGAKESRAVPVWEDPASLARDLNLFEAPDRKEGTSIRFGPGHP